MPRTKKKPVRIRKPMLVFTNKDNSDSDTVDNLAPAKQPESEMLLQKTVEMKRMSYLLIKRRV